MRDVEAAARALAGQRRREARARRPVVLSAVVPPSRAEARREHVLWQVAHCESQSPCAQTQNDIYCTRSLVVCSLDRCTRIKCTFGWHSNANLNSGKLTNY